MPLICYANKNFTVGTMAVIDQANQIIRQYADGGYDLTLRQLFYQFVSRDLLPNTQKSYKRLGSIINDARMAGLIDWFTIVDRTRSLRGNSHWESPSSIVESCAQQFRIDKWAAQPYRPEVWIEKDALVGVIERVCTKLDIDYFSCRGYTSQSEMWAASQRLVRYCRSGQTPLIIHLGDHDPSGIDMTRDVAGRLDTFMRYEGVRPCEVRRIALNMPQIEKFRPPPNPAKLTDSRARDYVLQHGYDSWELDALDPPVLSQLVEDTVLSVRDDALWNDKLAEERHGRRLLQKIADDLNAS